LEIVKLYPGESIRMVCQARLDTGRYHAKHVPAHVFHKRGPTPDTVDLVVECHGSVDARHILERALKKLAQ
jgi:hypothetical protein